MGFFFSASLFFFQQVFFFTTICIHYTRGYIGWACFIYIKDLSTPKWITKSSYHTLTISDDIIIIGVLGSLSLSTHLDISFIVHLTSLLTHWGLVMSYGIRLSTLDQVMACQLFGAEPLPEPMLTYHQLKLYLTFSMKFVSEIYDFF